MLSCVGRGGVDLGPAGVWSSGPRGQSRWRACEAEGRWVGGGSRVCDVVFTHVCQMHFGVVSEDRWFRGDAGTVRIGVSGGRRASGPCGRHGRVRTRSGAGSEAARGRACGKPRGSLGRSVTHWAASASVSGASAAQVSRSPTPRRRSAASAPVSQSSRWVAEAGPVSRGEAEAWDAVLTKRRWLVEGRAGGQPASSPGRLPPPGMLRTP